MQRKFGECKISRRTKGPEGDFVGPQTLFAWDLHSLCMQTFQNTIFGNKAKSNKVLFIYCISTCSGEGGSENANFCLFLVLKHAGIGGEGALCFEWGFTRTFPGNQDVAVK